MKDSIYKKLKKSYQIPEVFFKLQLFFKSFVMQTMKYFLSIYFLAVQLGMHNVNFSFWLISDSGIVLWLLAIVRHKPLAII